MDSSETKITFQKTSCYFCNEWLEDKGIKDHLLTCGQVLEKCPFNCLSYIQRKNMDKHMTVCSKRTSPVPMESKSDESLMSERLSLIEENLMFLRKTVNSEIKMRNDIIGDLGNIKKRNQITDEWTSKVSDVLNLLQKRIEEEKECRHLELKDFHGIVENLLKQFKEIKTFRDETTKTLSNVQTKMSISSSTGSRSIQPSYEWIDETKRLESEMNKLKFQSSDDMNDCVRYISTINNKLNQLELNQSNQHNYTDISSIQSLTRLDKLENELSTVAGLIGGLNERCGKTDYSVKQFINTINEIEDKSDKLNKQIELYKDLVYETKQDLVNLKEHLRVQRQFNLIGNIRGHLIWKIENYSKKLADAIESEIPLKSPLFSNKHYGYTLRLDVYLNGIGTWKNRNLIACLTIVNGDYDTLLHWPCKLKADIFLRDQPDNINNATDISKLVVTKKRNDKLEYQNQYIHISHQTINSANYIRNDAIILEVKVQKYEANSLKSQISSQI